MFDFVKNIFDNKPKTASKKTIYNFKKIRNYDAGNPSRLTSSAPTTPASALQVISRQHTILVARSRHQCLSDDYAKKFLTLLNSNVIGHQGIVLQCQSKDFDGKLDRLANEAIEKAWKNWSKAKHCDLEGKLSWIQLQKLALQTIAKDGEVFAYILRGRNYGKYGLQIQLLDPQRIDVNYNEDLKNGSYIRHGIEFNSYGKPTAVYINQNDISAIWASYQAGDKKRIPAEDILHCFLTEMIGQTRGIPWLATPLFRMMMLKGYENAAIVAARVGASKMGFFKRSDEGGEYTGEDDDGIEIDAAEPGVFEELPPGYSFEKFDPDYPKGEFDGFMRTCLRGISSGLGVSYNSLANDLTSVNFSSIRQGALDEREVWKCLQTWFIEQFHEPIFEKWLEWNLLSGNLRVNGKPLKAERLEKYEEVSWQPKRWQWIDPLKEVNANVAAIKAGIKSRSEVIHDMGRDPETVWNEIQRENQTLEDKGIPIEDLQFKDKYDVENLENQE